MVRILTKRAAEKSVSENSIALIRCNLNTPISVLPTASSELESHRVPEAFVELGMSVYSKHSNHWVCNIIESEMKWEIKGELP